jgi:hypothetical protein
MRLFLELHKRLQVIGRFIGAFTIFTVALLLYAAPFLCALSASVYLALGINILIGGGVWVFIAILFGLMTFFVVYVLPYVQKPVSRATTTLINVASELF